MKSVAKVAVSIPSDTLKLLERARARLRKTRSAVVAEAIERWLADDELSEGDKRYVEGYLRHPERADEISSVAAAVVGRWDRWE
jgi:metal-responsive CopG/Arc/MetJ family transcriptional regulator